MSIYDEYPQELTRQSDDLEKQQEKNLELRRKLREGRDYLMTVNPNEITVEDALEAFGFGRNGLKFD